MQQINVAGVRTKLCQFPVGVGGGAALEAEVGSEGSRTETALVRD